MDICSLTELLREDWIAVQLTKLGGTKVIWGALEPCLGSYDKVDYYNEILRSHSYAMSSCPIFESKEFSLEDCISGFGERYGGVGIGNNGGGGRCATYKLGTGRAYKYFDSDSIYQTKGVGPNDLVGVHEDKEHSYGGLDARKAIVETIYTNVLGHVLPLGTVKIHALIYTGEDTAYNGVGPCRGVLMVRDHCVRPAHFLKAASFKSSEKFGRLYPSELFRMRRMYRDAASRFENTSEFIKFIGGFLKNSANQFAFAKVARITHGTMSPSNMSIDGKWLDLPVCSFLSGGVNYNIWSQFYTESRDPLTYALEILHNYSKYNGVALNQNVLIKYYFEALETYFKVHLKFILGLDPRVDLTFLVQDSSLIFISTLLNKIVSCDRKIQVRRPVRDHRDPVVAYITGCYLSLVDLNLSYSYFRKTNISENDFSTLAKSFSDLFRRTLEECNFSLENYVEIYLSSFLVALKRAHLSSAFYLPVIDDSVKNLCANKAIEDIAPLINSFTKLSQWIFSEASNLIVIFCGNDIEIYYDRDRSLYVIDNGVIHLYRSFADMYLAIKKLDPLLFHINQFDYGFFFDELNQVIPIFESWLRTGTSNMSSLTPEPAIAF